MTTSNILTKAELSLEAENVWATHCYYHVQGHNQEELEDIWVTKDEGAKWTQGMGRRVRTSHMYLSMGLNFRRNALANYACLLEVYPDAKNYKPRPLFEMAMHTLTTPII